MTINDALKKGITRIRRSMWVDEKAYVKLDIVGTLAGPWMHLYDRSGQNAFGISTPQSIYRVGDTVSDYVEYVGIFDENDTETR